MAISDADSTATENTPEGTPKRDGLTIEPGRGEGLRMPEVVRVILTPLASVKLTVFLLVAAVVVTWIATLDQASIDIWELKRKHFGSWRVYVPFQTFFVPAWFPGFQSVPFGFWMPSGITLIVGMLVNLSAAHSLRFKIHARGGRFLLGLVAAVAAAALTWMIVFSGSSQRSFQGQPPVSYEVMWIGMQVALLGLSLASLVGGIRMKKNQRIEKSVLGFFGLLGILLLGVILYLGKSAFIGDSAMRILWQLLLSTLAASIGLVACLILFRRRAGIVLLHLGIAGLLANEIYVTRTNTEQQMLIEEGQTTSIAIDIRTAEMVVFDRSAAETDRIVTIPDSVLVKAAGTKEKISNGELPFDIEVEDYYVNSDFQRLSAPAGADDKGVAQTFRIFPAAPIPGTETELRNSAGAYVRLLAKDDGHLIGRYLLNQVIYQNNLVDAVEVEGKKYQIGLRDKEVYKPYSITLTDVQRVDYIGTTLPKWYASVFDFKDHVNGVSSEQKIWMNNPMRYAGETFYQQSYVPERDGVKEQTVIQIVKNRGWMIPYVCCMFTVVGLMYQFGTTLLVFLMKQQSRSPQAGGVKSERPVRDIKGWIPAVLLVGLFSIYCAGQFSKAVRPASSDEFRLDLLGQVPVTYEGRVKPLDSIARNLSRQMCNREVVAYRSNIKKPKFFGLYAGVETKPAMKWFADTIFKIDGFEKDYEILRVEDPTVQRALDLPRRKSMDYTLDELDLAQPQMRQLMADITQRESDTWTNFEKRVVEASGKVNRMIEMQVALGNASSWGNASLLNRLKQAEVVTKAKELPRSFPTGDADQPWVVWVMLQNKVWLRGLASEYGITNPAVLAQKLVDVDVVESLKKTMIFDAMKLELIKQGKKKSEVDLILEENGGKFPQAVIDELLPVVKPVVEEQIASRRVMADATTFSQIRTVLGDGEIVDDLEPDQAELVSLFSKLEPAYRDGNVEEFNSSLTAYLAKIDELKPSGYSSFKNRLEYVTNGFAPFYLSMVLYFVGFIVGLAGWIGYGRSLNRAAIGLVLMGVALQVLGLTARVMISGRPPVTNLYSSFLFVSTFGVMIMLVAERMTKIGVGTILGSSAGFLALLTAWSTSVREGDTFTVLRAVLDTQFWLTTHVICIAMGYVATLTAGLFGIAYVAGGLFSVRFDRDVKKMINTIIYGLVCFGLLFSFFGTVLGGLWADDSWGRFWGWDPKENGALMIVLWNAVVLHARWSGLVKARGMAMLAIFGNCVTIWSWEAVNQLGIGLHAYGFSEGRMKYVAIFWLVNIVLIMIGTIPTKYWRSNQTA